MKQKTGKYLLSILLILAMVVGLLPGIRLTAYADTYPTGTTVQFSDLGWSYGELESGVKITFNKPVEVWIDDGRAGAYSSGSSWTTDRKYFKKSIYKMDEDENHPDGYWVLDLSTVDRVTINPTNAGTINVGETASFTATVSPEDAPNRKVKWSLEGPNPDAVKLYSDAACNNPVGTDATDTITVFAKGMKSGTAYIRATSSAYSGTSVMVAVTVNAASYSVTITPGSNMTKTAESGDASQTGLSGAMTDVVYTANTGYKFSDTSDAYTTTNGIAVTRTSDTVLTVSGTPTADTSITIPDAVSATPVTGVSLDQVVLSLTVYGDAEALTANIDPSGATDKKVKWSVDGGVALYSDQACTQAVGADATETLTVYAKGTAAGMATVTATSNADETKSAACVVTVSKADPTAPTNLTATYGQTLADVALPDGWTWADSTQSVGSVVSPAATFKADFAGNSNYNPASNVDVAVTVNKAANPATVNGTASVTKGGNTVDLAGNVTLNGATGAVSYAIAGEANGCTLSGSVLTAGNTTGPVTVNVSVAEDANYNASAAMPVTVAVNDKQTQTITAADVTATYGDTGKGISASVTEPATGGGTLSYAVKSGDAVTVDSSTGALTIAKAGTAVITVTAAETATYAQTTKDVTVTVNKANAAASTVTANNRNYDGTEKPLIHIDASTLLGGEMQYALGTASEATESYTTAIPAKTEAGTYYVWYKVKGDDNHTDSAPACVTVTVHMLTVTFEVNGGSAVAAQGVASGATAVRPDAPTKSGYIFDGWYQDATLSVPFDFATPITADITLYARWADYVYQVTGVTGTTTDANHIWYKQSGTDTVTNNNTGVEITVKLTNGPDDSFDHFTGVQLDGVTLTRDVDYAARAGSTVVTLYPATLRRLSRGAHTVTVLFDNNSVSTRLTVRQNSSTPATGDESNAALYLTVLVLSALGMAAVTVESKKRRTAKR